MCLKCILEVGIHSYSDFVFRKIYYSGALDSALDNKLLECIKKGLHSAFSHSFEKKIMCLKCILEVGIHSYSDFVFRKYIT
jgi:hypothetical protein